MSSGFTPIHMTLKREGLLVFSCGGCVIRRSVSSVVATETALRVAYSYPGSFGVVFTVPNDRMLIPDIPTRLDKGLQRENRRSDREQIVKEC